MPKSKGQITHVLYKQPSYLARRYLNNMETKMACFLTPERLRGLDYMRLSKENKEAYLHYMHIFHLVNQINN